MEIVKYKYMGNGKYKVYFPINDYVLYEDVILKYNILTKKDITKEELIKLLDENNYYEEYNKTLKYLAQRTRSKKEVRDYLTKNEVKNEYIEKIINNLTKNGYLNDKIFCNLYIKDAINLKDVGPLKIKRELKGHDIEEETIDEELKQFTKDIQIKKIDKYINNKVKINKNKSLAILKQKLLNDLINKGYYREDIISILNNINIDDEKIKDLEYQKLYNKLSKKYSGSELSYKIKQKLYQKGFR